MQHTLLYLLVIKVLYYFLCYEFINFIYDSQTSAQPLLLPSHGFSFLQINYTRFIKSGKRKNYDRFLSNK